MRIDFYVIEDEHSDAPRRVAARLLEKAYQQNLRAWVLCANQTEAEKLDNWLWTYKKTSFLPHSLASSVPKGLNPPIQITADNTAPKENTFDLLLNLREDIPVQHTTFTRILELVPRDQKQAGRARYKAYRDQGFSINKHSI
ncbi:MAG: DNA polymerase III subunit chi [Gammaproteobacteria bacterium]|nr:DNA polymerase III subunit chi [Gammaproteobacteria bacterium]